MQPGNSNVSADINSMAILARPGGSFAGIEYAQVDLDKSRWMNCLLYSYKDNKWSLLDLYTLNKNQLVRMTTKEND